MATKEGFSLKDKCYRSITHLFLADEMLFATPDIETGGKSLKLISILCLSYADTCNSIYGGGSRYSRIGNTLYD